MSEPVCRDEQDLATQGNGQKHSLGRTSRGTRCEQHRVAKAPVEGARGTGVRRDCHMLSWRTHHPADCKGSGLSSRGAWGLVLSNREPSIKENSSDGIKRGGQKKKKETATGVICLLQLTISFQQINRIRNIKHALSCLPAW